MSKAPKTRFLADPNPYGVRKFRKFQQAKLMELELYALGGVGRQKSRKITIFGHFRLFYEKSIGLKSTFLRKVDFESTP